MLTCTRCGRTRGDEYIVLRKLKNGKKRYRCKAKSVCSSIARRRREAASRESDNRRRLDGIV